MPGHHSRGYDAARARLIASRFVRDDRPRIRVRIDPIVRRSLQILTASVVLLLLSVVLAPGAP